MNITIYTKPGCPNCDAAKRLMDAKGIAYTALDVSANKEALEWLHMFPDARQMPQIVINGQRVGGLAGLQAALKQLNL